jgi:hypothetical protein
MCASDFVVYIGATSYVCQLKLHVESWRLIERKCSRDHGGRTRIVFYGCNNECRLWIQHRYRLKSVDVIAVCRFWKCMAVVRKAYR